MSKQFGQAAYKRIDIASASTLNLSAVNEAAVRITGTTAINAITMRAWQRLYLIFAAALTIAHNASLVLPNNGSPITTAAGDTAIVTADGAGAVTFQHYQRASGQPVASGAASFTNITVTNLATLNHVNMTGDFISTGTGRFHVQTNSSQGIIFGQTTTYPALWIDTTTASSKTGVKITSKAAGAGVTLAAIGDNAVSPNENLVLAGFGVNGHVVIDQTFRPLTHNTRALGISGTAWSTLFLGTAGAIDFATGGIRIAEATNTLVIDRASVVGSSVILSPGSGGAAALFRTDSATSVPIIMLDNYGIAGIAQGVNMFARFGTGGTLASPAGGWQIISTTGSDWSVPATRSAEMQFSVRTNNAFGPELLIGQGVTVRSSEAIPAGGSINMGYKFGTTVNAATPPQRTFGIFAGSGAPTLAAAQGSIYLRSDNAAGARAYVATSSAGGAGAWTTLTAAA